MTFLFGRLIVLAMIVVCVIQELHFHFINLCPNTQSSSTQQLTYQSFLSNFLVWFCWTKNVYVNIKYSHQTTKNERIFIQMYVFLVEKYSWQYLLQIIFMICDFISFMRHIYCMDSNVHFIQCSLLFKFMFNFNFV